MTAGEQQTIRKPSALTKMDSMWSDHSDVQRTTGVPEMSRIKADDKWSDGQAESAETTLWRHNNNEFLWKSTWSQPSEQLSHDRPAAGKPRCYARACAHLQSDKASDALFPFLIIGSIADRFQFVVLLITLSGRVYLSSWRMLLLFLRWRMQFFTSSYLDAAAQVGTVTSWRTDQRQLLISVWLICEESPPPLIKLHARACLDSQYSWKTVS